MFIEKINGRDVVHITLSLVVNGIGSQVLVFCQYSAPQHLHTICLCVNNFLERKEVYA